ncbi:hypothetical protein PCANC_13187 [Puccinia coronata f. sp. avenae]|uniref:Uncharacterized protein n=1 Tax=Puccinia coronata f. sp. avenae TaxID=200324 RepID=A0A2N5UVM9_9BASI|nr:hypothetical protein PCANC_13187 [Puccinia coronata f. sp. avenae]
MAIEPTVNREAGDPPLRLESSTCAASSRQRSRCCSLVVTPAVSSHFFPGLSLKLPELLQTGGKFAHEYPKIYWSVHLRLDVLRLPNPQSTLA